MFKLFNMSEINLLTTYYYAVITSLGIKSLQIQKLISQFKIKLLRVL